jgi:hypothetical protein
VKEVELKMMWSIRRSASKSANPTLTPPGFCAAVERRPNRREGGRAPGRACRLVAAAFALGCALDPQPEPFPLALRIVSDPGEGLAGAAVAYGQEAPQLSDEQGRVKVRVHGRQGDTASFVVRCPDGYRSPSGAVGIALRRFADPSVVPEHEVACPPLSHTLVVAVRAPGGAELPVLADGMELTRTDAQGVAHVSWDLPVGTSLELTLDTSARPELLPQSPRQRFSDLSGDEVALFERHFERRPFKPPGRRLPIQIYPYKP